jgi:predicted DCC family thiol-disulfide oxidoreductase YuxK
MESHSENSIVLFDGVCNLCEMTVQFIIRRDRAGHFRFASLQSPVAQRLLEHAGYPYDALSSVLLLSHGKLYRKSRAALQICKRLDGLWPAVYYAFAWVPAIIADVVYDYVGKRRYRWFGQKHACWLPSPELTSRFLDMPR